MNDDRQVHSAQTVVELVLVRHGESLGNVAATEALRAGTEVIDVPARDADVDLSPLGYDQANALGRFLASFPPARVPDAIWCSPYERARRTAEVAAMAAGWAVPILLDERLRDRELGILDTLTAAGVEVRHPGEAARRSWLGKFYYRPPGGESWADVVLRLRSVLSDLERHPGAGRILVVSHDAVILLFRYILEGLSERQLLDVAAGSSVLNASLTRYARAGGRGPWTLESFNDADHLADQGVALTEHGGDADVHPR